MLIVLIVSSLWTSGVCATESNTHDQDHGYDWHCLMENPSTVAEKFKNEVNKKEARAVKLPINRLNRMYDICQNTSHGDIKPSHLMWAASEKEPYLYIHSHFYLFSRALSLHSTHETEINISCTGQEQNGPPNKHNGTSFLDAVMESVRQKLMQTTEAGTLCYHNSDSVLFALSKNAYKCCGMSKSAKTCIVVHPPVKYVDWYHTLQIIWLVLAGMTLMYLPAVICLFPAGPKVSDDTPCIELGDPSPAGFYMFVAKAFFIPQKMESCKDKAKFLFLRLIAFPIITGLPLLIYILYLTALYDLPLPAKIPSGVVFGLAYFGKSIHFAFLNCELVNPGIREALKNWLRKRDAKIKSISSRWFSLVNRCSQFESPESKYRRFFCTLAIFLFGPVALLVLFFLFVIFIILFCTFFCPLIIGVFKSEMNYKNYKSSIRKFKGLKLCMYSLGSFLSCLGIFLWLFVNVAICAALLPYSIMAVIDYEQDVLPRVSLTLVILYYFHIYFTKFSEKYQLLKLELYEGIQKHHTSTGNAEDVKALLLKTKSEGSVAIPEKLYKAACKELQMCMITDALWAFLKFFCLSTFVFSFFCSVMIFGDRLGSGNLTEVVATFLAGFLPKLLTLFSGSDGSQTLKNIEKKERLESVITKYAAGELEQTSDKNELDMRLLAPEPS